MNDDRVNVTQADVVGVLEEIANLHGEINIDNYDHDDACELNRQFCYAITLAHTTLTALRAQPPASDGADRVEALEAERDFLLARSKRAGSVSFGAARWTGMSSNALVAIAFGGVDDCLPKDGGELASGYRTVQRLPPHLVSPAVTAQLEQGERRLPRESVEWARIETDWPKKPAGSQFASLRAHPSREQG